MAELTELTIQPRPLTLSPEEQELLIAELGALTGALPPDRTQPYLALAQAAQTGTIPSAQIPLLESVLELVLGSGRVRHDHRAEGERLLMALYKRTARGQAADAALAHVNTALAVLQGHKVTKVEATCRVPGNYSLTLDTETLHLQLTLDARGIRIEKTAI